MNKPPRRVRWLPMPPRGLRRKLSPGQVSDLALVHIANLDLVATGRAGEQVLWHVAEAALLWSRVAELLQAGAPEMRDQLELAAAMVERYGRTGRVGFSGTEYQRAKEGVQVMDQLAEIVDQATANAAADWAERRVNELEAACREQQRQVA